MDPLLRADHKSTSKWVWLGSRDPISKFLDPNNFWTNSFKFGKDIEDWPSLRTDYKTNPKWAWPGSRDLFSKFCDTISNFWTNRAIRFKFCTDIEDGPSLRTDYKTTPKWAWPGSRDQISKFWDSLTTFEGLSNPYRFEGFLARLVQGDRHHVIHSLAWCALTAFELPNWAR